MSGWLPAAAVRGGMGDKKDQGVEKSALLDLLLQILYPFFYHTVGGPRDLGLIEAKDMTTKSTFLLIVHG